MKKPAEQKQAASDESMWDNHRRAQILHWAFHTTAEERLTWIEQMLTFMAQTGMPYQERKRKFKGGPPHRT